MIGPNTPSIVDDWQLSKMGIRLLILVCLLASMAIAAGVSSYFAINKSRDSIQGSIADSVIT